MRLLEQVIPEQGLGQAEVQAAKALEPQGAKESPPCSIPPIFPPFEVILVPAVPLFLACFEQTQQKSSPNK